MSATAPLRCLFSKCRTPAQSSFRRTFRSSTASLSSSDPSNVPTKRSKEGLPRRYRPYSKEDKARLQKSYTPDQLAALEAGEAAIDPKDLADQGTIREDPFAFTYIDDFSQIHPVIDQPIRAPKENHDPKQRLKNEDEIAEDFAKFLQKMPKNPTRLDYMKFRDDMRLTVGKEQAERNPRSSLAPEIPKGIPVLQRGVAIEESDIDPAMKRLIRQTGLPFEVIRKFRVKNLVTHRVVNQTRLGKIQSMYYLTVAGNGKGLLGIGEGKSAEPEDARRQAYFNAIRNLQPVPRYEDRTIFGDVKVKFGAVEIELMTRPPGLCSQGKVGSNELTAFLGFGIRCQDKIFEMCRCVGISDLAARVTRSRNPMNTIKATFQALVSQRLPDEVARGLGRKLVDVRKVYYGANA